MKAEREFTDDSMRLFISINPDKTARKQITAIQQQLKQFTVSGHFTQSENLHLTLIFIGKADLSQSSKIQTAMDASSVTSFPLIFSGVGNFGNRSGRNRKLGDIWWLGIEECPSLILLQQQLFNELRKAGFPLKKQVYTPHLTIGRAIQLSDNPRIKYNRFDIQVNQISLMHSQQVDGLLTYTEIYKKLL